MRSVSNLLFDAVSTGRSVGPIWSGSVTAIKRGITAAAIKIRPRGVNTRPTRLEVRTPMSTQKSNEKEIPPSPLISAADLEANNYVTAPFDDDIALERSQKSERQIRRRRRSGGIRLVSPVNWLLLHTSTSQLIGRSFHRTLETMVSISSTAGAKLK